MVERTVPLLQERIYEPPRSVEVEYEGHWIPGLQRSWHHWDDHRGWVAEVEVTVSRYWGVLTRCLVVEADRVRLAGSAAPANRPVGVG